ncbi:MAG: pantetheine-phosphate adenylyltransferase, partial [Candidatus Woesearchaeota archaeon]
MKKAFFAYSGDPITYGHIDLIERAAKKTDKLIVGFGINPNKRPSFSMREKIDMAKHVLSHIPNIDIVSYTGNIANFAFKKGISVIFRGIRNSSDLEAEKQLSDGCKRQGSDVEFEYLEAKNELADVSSTNVKGWAVAQGFIHEYVPLYVKQRVEARLLSQYPFGVTGSIATGKSTLSKKLREIGNKKGIPVFDLDLDSIAKSIYLASDDYEATREQIFSTFGHDLKNDDDSVNIKKLGSIVFNDDAKLDALNKIMYKPIKSTLQDHMIYRKGLIMHNAALLAELGMGFLCNNNVVVVDTSVEEQRRRLEERVSNGFMTKEQIERRLGSQYTSQKKKEIIQSWIDKTSQGKIWNVDSTRIKSDNYYELFFDTVIKPVDIYGEL